MLCVNCDFDCLWFPSKESKPLITEAIRSQAVNVPFANPEKKQYVSVTGLAQLVDDEKMIQKLWHPEFKSWFPEGGEASQTAGCRGETAGPGRRDQPIEHVPYKIIKPVQQVRYARLCPFCRKASGKIRKLEAALFQSTRSKCGATGPTREGHREALRTWNGRE